MRASLTVAVLARLRRHCSSALHAEQAESVLGNWNMTGVAPDVNYVYWLEVTQEGDQLKGMFLNRSGHPVPLPCQGREQRAGISGIPAVAARGWTAGTERTGVSRQASTAASSSDSLSQPGGRGREPRPERPTAATGRRRASSTGSVSVRRRGPPQTPMAGTPTASRSCSSTARRSTPGRIRTCSCRTRGRSRTATMTNAYPKTRRRTSFQGEIRRLQDRGRIQAREGQQQRDLPARPLRAAGPR